MSDVLTDEEIERIAIQIVRDAGTIAEASMLGVIDEMQQLKISATLWRLWKSDQLRLGWNPDDGLLWKAT